MSALIALVALVLHLALMLATAPLLVGALQRTRARLAGAVGPPLLQPWRDLLRLLRKQPVVSEGASWLFLAAPAARLAALLAAAALVPSFSNGMATAGLADLLAIAGLLALARAIQVLAALDSAVPAAGIAASRVVAQASLAEPALLATVFALGAATGTTHMAGIVAVVRDAGSGLAGPLALLALALLPVALAANGRLPTTDPSAGQTTAMLDAAMALPHGGRHLALLEIGDALRLLLWLSLLVALLLPAGIAAAGVAPGWWLLGLLAWAGKIAVLGLALAVLESLVPAMRRTRLPAVFGTALLMALLAVLVLFAGQGAA